MAYSEVDPLWVRADIPQSARIWNYWMGGKDYYEIDRIVGEECRAIYPDVTAIARQSQQFLARTVIYLTAEAGVRQFIDIGCGLPALYNTHSIAQGIAPESRIVYVDHDPLVLTHARAMLTSTTPEGFTFPLDVDFHDTDRMLADSKIVLDFGKPIAVMFMGVLGYAKNYDLARQIVRTVTDLVPSGSYLALWDGTDDHPDYIRMCEHYNRSGAVPYTPRTRQQFHKLFDGWEFVDPGLVAINQWRPPSTEIGQATPLPACGALAHLPAR
ncbi:SAM-dependent methyltransferase [Nocardia xishanensis]|uniref:SAM-dependent methyltransferase n=1 Tax=Nocardia xishanensis TaxID=238964 RepID=UPI00082B3BD2|nr:SAM-dependent methyltransferase [Nocardia xishanensis]